MAEDGDFKTLRPIVRKINIAAANPEAYQKLVKNGFNKDFGKSQMKYLSIQSYLVQ